MHWSDSAINCCFSNDQIKYVMKATRVGPQQWSLFQITCVMKLKNTLLNVTYCFETSQELRMLSSVTLNCQATKIVMKSGSQLSELWLVSQMSQVSGIVYVIVFVIAFVFVFVFVRKYLTFLGLRTLDRVKIWKCDQRMVQHGYPGLTWVGARDAWHI